MEIKPNPGPQTQAFASSADLLIYGGGAGGGKSFLLLTEPLRHVHRKGFGGVIFRRTFAQVTQTGGLWDESQDLYRPMGGKPRGGTDLDWTFPSGAKIGFAHLQHEKDKYNYQGGQIAYLGFDELTHFTESQFFYIITRARSKVVKPYIRASCNPEPGWVADFIAWWIDAETGLAIPERSGVIRYFCRDTSNDKIVWGDSKQELLDQFPHLEGDSYNIMSATFIPAKLSDNPKMIEKDPGYKGRLMSQSRIERERLLGCNWKTAEGTQIDANWIRRYSINNDQFEFVFQDRLYTMPSSVTRRIATIDTAGTSKEKAATKRGQEPSWSVCGVWDIVPRWTLAVDNRQVHLTELCFLRYVWRKQVDWNQLKVEVDETLGVWNVTKAYIENAHFGQPLSKEIRSCATELIGPVIPGMGDHSEGAKLERAIASGVLARFEHGKIFIPQDSSDWIQLYLRELLAWTGHPGEVADQIDMTSYVSYVSKISSAKWGGTIPTNSKSR